MAHIEAAENQSAAFCVFTLCSARMHFQLHGCFLGMTGSGIRAGAFEGHGYPQRRVRTLFRNNGACNLNNDRPYWTGTLGYYQSSEPSLESHQ